MFDPARRPLLCAAVAGVMLAGCTPSEQPVEPAPEQAAPEQAEEPGAGSAPDGLGRQVAVDELPSDVDLPDDLDGTAVTAGLLWVLESLAGEQLPPVEEVEAVFADVALAQVPAPQLQSVFGQLAGSYRITGLERADASAFVGEIDDGQAQRWRLVLEMSTGEPPEIETLFFGTPLEDPASFGSWDEVDAALGQDVAQMSYLAAEVSDGVCEPVASAGPEQRGQIASVAKLYVLGAVADAVAAGDLAWDDELEVTEELRSLPTGQLQDAEPGTLVTVEQAAELMIAISDNTATDLLIDAVGRAAVEEALASYGHGAPEVNEPFLTTRELFQLTWQVDDQTRQQYLQGATGERRQILDDLAEEPLTVTAEDVIGPPVGGMDDLGWLASAEDLCGVLVALGDRAEGELGGPVREALGANPIVRLGSEWRASAAKGGSLPAVLAFAWLLERDDGREFAFVVRFADDIPIDELAIIPSVEGALALLAETDR